MLNNPFYSLNRYHVVINLIQELGLGNPRSQARLFRSRGGVPTRREKPWERSWQHVDYRTKTTANWICKPDCYTYCLTYCN